MSIQAFDATENLLLAALAPQDLGRWRSCLQEVVVAGGELLHEARQPPRYAYFPAGAVVSLQVQSERGDCDEIALVGREGMVGITAFTGAAASTMRAVAQSPGRAFRLSAEAIRTHLPESPAVWRLLLQYVVSQQVQVAQGVVCSRHHSIEQRLALRLLAGIRLQQGTRLAITHEQLSVSLGVGRASVTREAIKLQEAGVIAYSRGSIHVLDRGGLELRCCECSALIAGGRGLAAPGRVATPVHGGHRPGRAERHDSIVRAEWA